MYRQGKRRRWFGDNGSRAQVCSEGRPKRIYWETGPRGITGEREEARRTPREFPGGPELSLSEPGFDPWSGDL